MYAQVVPDVTTAKEKVSFTYQIPKNIADKIIIGQRVLIPFHQRKIEGVIVGISSHRPIAKKLKKIAKILDPTPVLDHLHLKLAQFISQYYFCPLSLAIFAMVPPQPKRKKLLKQNDEQDDFCGIKNNFETKLVCDRHQSRIKMYAQLAFKNYKQDKSSIIIFPESKLSQLVLEEFRLYFPISRICVWHSKLKNSQKFEYFLKIREGRIKIIIGSRSAIFTPVQNLGLIILDQDDDQSNKQEQSPRYHSKKVAAMLAKLTGAKLILGNSVISVENYFHLFKKNIEKILKNCNFNKIDTSLVDMNNQPDFLSVKVGETMQDFLKIKNKVLLFLARRGTASAVYCVDCEKTILCPKCDRPAIYHSSPLPCLICHTCGNRFGSPLRCPNCHSTKIKFLGIGSEKIESEIKRCYFDKKILRIDKDTAKKEITGLNSADIVIATAKIFDFPQFEPDLTAVLSLDNILNLPDFQSQEEVFKTLLNLNQMTKKKMIVQTYHPANEMLLAFKNNQFDNFYRRELHQRFLEKYPPFTHLIKLQFAHQNEKLCESETFKLASKLKQLAVASPAILKIMGPNPAFTYRQRNKYRWQIIIKLFKQDLKIRDIILKQVPEKWTIDIDPFNLL
ncbi:MAG: primosomal protein N' [Candidatus Nealsonbacteria bacterium CG07_land_8_20_14_0_80_40_10]|nr:MAG: primosomal protein N' [Candidatus Nealsonbacteria bacterium CG10_big_fil_rev_8_21_14_0_10_40_24]PIU43090.1 MAG: primosomal protein N' [Candidatus Nealsonbacteria bacterium CG07_land_8_20_14_0_80_40_10]